MMRLRARYGGSKPTDAAVAARRRAVQRTSFGGAVLVAVARGEKTALADLVESIKHHEGDAVKIIVVDGLTGEYSDAVVERDFPGVDFVQPPTASGHSQCPFRVLQTGLLHILRSYEVPAILKLDPDSLLIGQGAFESAKQRFDSDPTIGLLGTTSRQADGRETDYSWNSWVAHPEIRWSPRLRRLLTSARRTFPSAYFAHAGACFYLPRAVDAAVSQGLLPYRQPSWSLLGDDVMMGLILRAAGFRIESFGAPGDPIACAHSSLPLEPEDALAKGVKVVHSVRRSPSGMTEGAVRAYFRRARAATGGGREQHATVR